MAHITLGGNPVETVGSLPKIGAHIPDFKLVAVDLSSKTLEDFKDKNLILCISRDLPFAQDQFCGAEGLKNVVMLSDFKSGDFGRDYGVMMTNGKFDGLLSRCVIVVDAARQVLYTEQVPEIGQEPNYKTALEVLYS